MRISNKNITGKRWYIWYTKPRAEKKVLERLLAKDVESFLPLKKEFRQWSDRKKWVESPLFNGYIFTNIADVEVEKVLFTEGILNYVRFDGKPALLRQEQVDEINLLLSGAISFDIEEDNLQPGERIEITAGPFVGMQGEMVSYKGLKRLAIKIEQLAKVVLVELPKEFVGRI